MRVLAAALVIGCGSSHAPQWNDADFVYAFSVETDELPGDPPPKYEFRLDGDCLGRGVVGEPFTPHKDRSGATRPLRVVPRSPGEHAGSDARSEPTPKVVWLAPKDDIAVGLIIGDEHRGCVHAQLDRSHTTVVRL